MEIIHVDTIEKYNRLFGFETRHPLVSVVRFDGSETADDHQTLIFGFYAIFIKQTAGCKIDYGKTSYDYDGESVVSFAPGQSVTVHRSSDGPAPKSIGLLFHPDFLFRTSLARRMNDYSFFSYSSNEALHLSTDELAILEDYLSKIVRELEHPIDRFSKSLIVSNIELILNYCMRFYERQFITREVINNTTMDKFDKLLDNYLLTGLGADEGIPTVKYFADKVCLSPNYFGDLVKAETGKTAQEYIRLKMINLAKEALHDPELNTKQIAERLGFQYPQHFNRFFKKLVGQTPREYRLGIN